MSNLPLYLAYVVTALGLLGAFTAIYVYITPYHELALIRAGNRTAAFSLGGVLIGFGLVLASTVAHSVNLLDMALWGGVALAFQILVFLLAALLLKELRAGIEADKHSYGITLAAMSIATGLINAGAVTY